MAERPKSGRGQRGRRPGAGDARLSRPGAVGGRAGAPALRARQPADRSRRVGRDLQPAVVVLEDVDLVAMDRSFGPDGSPVLFDLLDAMDGAAPDADLLFVLTNDRADLLEPALAARPGRIDVAVDVDLPDAAARRRLLELYGRDVPLRLSEDDVTPAVDRTEGVTASFLGESLRRAVLEALHEQDPVSEVTSEHLTRALDDLLDSSQQVTRTPLGVGGDAVTKDGAGARPGLSPASLPIATYHPRHPRRH
ncbi:AAA family ATPase [Geodermatophilus maliterrae]|uniref:AAA family ATPase n=1 Tax=Geodermatophilus maliterrae TaxID=3162531 RepID=A0ABV3X8P8_9ACTN